MKMPLRRHRHSWEDNIRTDLMEIWWGGADWIHLGFCERGNEQSHYKKGWEFLN
jgi:hypothetical protein